jgi:hypothetical protein
MELVMPTTSVQGIFPSFSMVALLAALVVIALLVIMPLLIAIVAATGLVAQPTATVADTVSPIFGVTVPGDIGHVGGCQTNR